MLAKPVISLQAGLKLDAQEVLVHTAGEEDVRLMAAVDSDERVYTPTNPKNLWSPHKAMWQVSTTTNQGVALVQEYRRPRLFKTWLRQLEREFVRWEHVSSKHWEDRVAIVNYLRSAHQQTIYQEMVSSHISAIVCI